MWSLPVEWILDRTGTKCLWWSSLPVVGERAEGRGLLEGGCPASNGAEFGRMRWTEVRGISEWVDVGFRLGFRRLEAKWGAGSLWEGRVKLQVAWVRLGSQFGEVLGVFGALVCCVWKRQSSGVLGGFLGKKGSLSRSGFLWKSPVSLPGCSSPFPLSILSSNQL